jgi:hypothetical protein
VDKQVPVIRLRQAMILVSPSVEVATADAMARGWKMIARGRFADEASSTEIRLICRYSELPAADQLRFFQRNGRIRMIKSTGYKTGEGSTIRENWLRDMARFDDLVAAGHAEWVDPADLASAEPGLPSSVPPVRRRPARAAF